MIAQSISSYIAMCFHWLFNIGAPMRSRWARSVAKVQISCKFGANFGATPALGIIPRPYWPPAHWSRHLTSRYHHGEQWGRARPALLCSQEWCVDEHAKLKAKMKTKQSSQPRNPSPTCVSRVTWGQEYSLIPYESHEGSHKGRSEGSHKDKGCDRRGSAIPWI